MSSKRYIFDCWIEEVHPERRLFTARLTRGKHQYLGEFTFNDVEEGQRGLIEKGRLFTLFVGEDAAKIVMSELPDWTPEEIAEIERRAERLYKKIFRLNVARYKGD